MKNRSEHLCTVLLVFVLAATLSCAIFVLPQTAEDAARYCEQSSAGVLTVKGLAFNLPDGSRSKAITVFLDGERLNQCEVSETPSDTCVDGLRVPPGSHTLDIAIGCQDPETLRWLNCRWDVWDRIVIAPRERVTFDVAGSAAHPDEQERYVDRLQGEALRAPQCLQTLEALAFAPSCTAEEIDAAIELNELADQHCSARTLEGQQRFVARHLLTASIGAHFNPPIDRCLSGYQRGRGRNRLPPGIWNSWHGDVMEGGSWRWARAVLPQDASDDTSPKALFEVIRNGLRQARPRVAVVEEVIEAFSDDDGISDFRRRAMSEPWSFEPHDLNGHRHQWIVAARWHDDAYDRYLFEQIANDSALDCSNYQAVERLLPYLLEGRFLSRDRWEAARAMIERTPSEERVGIRCTHVFNPSLESDVPLEERLRWLGNWDCSEQRHPALRSHVLEAQLRQSTPRLRVPDELRQQLYQDLEACFPGPPPVN